MAEPLDIVLSGPARRDLLDIWSYVAQDDIETADRFVDTLLEKLPLLAESPGIGSPRDYLLPGLRARVQGRYVIYYRVVDGQLIVMRVAHGARDRSSLFES